MEDENNSIQLHSIIDNALFVVDMREYQAGIYEHFLESEEEEKKKWELSEDESMWNQNVIGIRQRVDEEAISKTRERLEYYKQELEEAKILLRIYMEAFNGGWVF